MAERANAVVNTTGQPEPPYRIVSEVRTCVSTSMRREDIDRREHHISAGFKIPATLRMKAGRYFAGDPCYAAGLAHDEFYAAYSDARSAKRWRTKTIVQGLYDKRPFISVNLNSDGVATDESGHEYGIETASFCVMRLNDDEHMPLIEATEADVASRGNGFYPEVCGREYDFAGDVTIEITKSRVDIEHMDKRGMSYIDYNVLRYALSITDGMTYKVFYMFPLGGF